MSRPHLLLVSSLLAGLLVACAAGPAVAQTEPGQSQEAVEQDETERNACRTLPGISGVACDAVRGTIGGGARIVTSGADAALRSMVKFVVDGAGWLLGQIANVIDRSTRPELTARWFGAAYSSMSTVAVLALLPFLLLAIIQAVVRQDFGQLLRSVFAYVPMAALGTAGAIVVVDMLVTITDEMSAWIGRGMGDDLSAFASGLGTALTKLSAAPATPQVAGLASLLAAAVIGFAAFVIWLELLLRVAAIYVAVLFLPMAFAAMVWPATAHWLRRLVQGLVAIILSKFVIVAVMALGAAAMNAQVTDEGFSAVISGAALLSLAALAPYVLLRLIPVFEAGVSSSLEGTYRRPTAAVGAPHAPRGMTTQLLRQRVRGGVGSAAMPAALATGGLAAGAAATGMLRTGASGIGGRVTQPATATDAGETAAPSGGAVGARRGAPSGGALGASTVRTTTPTSGRSTTTGPRPTGAPSRGESHDG